MEHGDPQAAHIPRMVRAAFRAMCTGRPGAAHLGLPYDIQYDPVDPGDIWADPELATFPAYRAAPDPAAIEAAVEAILSAREPLIVCGGGVVIADAMGELARLAERLDIAVATSISGQGALADSHPNALGVVGSNGGTDETWEAMETADLVVFMGCRAGSTTTARWEAPKPGTRIVHFDSDPMVIGANYPTEVGVVADLRLALPALNAVLDGAAGGRFGGAAAVADRKARKFARFAALAASDAAPIRPERLIAALQTVLPEDAMVSRTPAHPAPIWPPITGRRCRGGGSSPTARMARWAMRCPPPWVPGMGGPIARIVALMGDGSFGFACGELETIARAGRRSPSSCCRMPVSAGSRPARRPTRARYYNVDFNRVDHARIADAYGLKTWQVTEPADLIRTLDAALSHDGPALVDVIVQPLEEAAAPVRRWMG
jgi:acetolactate synthase-1/2/3 large subunit